MFLLSADNFPALIAPRSNDAFGTSGAAPAARSLRQLARQGAAQPQEARGPSPQKAAAPPPPQFPWIYQYELDRRGSAEKGDCPVCGAYGAHPEKIFRLRPSGTPTKARECRSCTAKFSWEQPKAPEKEAPLTWDMLPEARDPSYNDCPSCHRNDVDTYVIVDGLKACKCSAEHVFKPRRPGLLTTEWLPRDKR